MHLNVLHLVYVIGLHAVQFGNNWMKKTSEDCQIGRGRRPSPIWQSEEFFESNYFQIGQHVVVLPINYIVYYLRVKNNADFVRNILFQNIFGIQINS